MDNYEKLENFIKQAKYLVAFTGAGISVLSGIRDFRGKNGLYTSNIPNAERMFDLSVFIKDPAVYYSSAKDFIYGLEEKQPSVVHRVLAELENKGILKSIITQNIDLLHQKAGSGKVLEIHGSPQTHYCMNCGKEIHFGDILPEAKQGKVPKCACGGVFKPRITFFGEALPFEALMKAQEESAKADALLVLGSSLMVYPAAGLPELTLARGGKIAIVNNQPTHLDRNADLRFTDLEETFNYLEKKLKKF